MKISTTTILILVLVSLSGGVFLGKSIFSPINPRQTDYDKMLNYAQASIHEQSELDLYQEQLTKNQKDFTAVIGDKKYKHLLTLLKERQGLVTTMDLITCAYKKRKCPKGETQKDLVQAGLKFESYLRSTVLTAKQKTELDNWWQELQRHRSSIPVKEKLNLPEASKDSIDRREKEEREKVREKKKAHIRAEFRKYRKYIYGPLAQFKNNERFYKELRKGKKRFIDAGISNRDFTNTMGLAKRRVEWQVYRYILLCSIGEINEGGCPGKHTAAESKRAKRTLQIWSDDPNALTAQQRSEINDFLKKTGLNN